MGRGAVKKAPKKVAPKKRGTSVAAIKLGDEPSFICEPSTSELVNALNWYNKVAEDPEQHKLWVVQFLTDRGWNDENVKLVAGKVKKLLPTHIFVARMFNRGLPLDDRYADDSLRYFQHIVDRYSEDELDDEGNPVAKAPVTKLATKIAPMVNFIEEQIEGIMQGDEPANVYQKLLEMGCNGAVATQLRNVFSFQSAEFAELSKPYTCGDDLEEAYSYLSVATRKKLGAFMQKLNDDLNAFAKVAKATRKPRKKKAPKVEKVVQRVKYKAKDDTYKIASVPPTQIVGAKWLWTFNTKTRMLAWYESETGLTVKGTTLQNYKACGQKKLRKPEEQLKDFTAGAVKALPKSFDRIKTTASEANGRINVDTILLRVFN